jgi:hypothetical protein
MCSKDFEAAVLAFLMSCSWTANIGAEDKENEEKGAASSRSSSKREREPKLVSRWFAEKKKWPKDMIALIESSKTPPEVRVKATSLLKLFNERQILFCPKEQTELHDMAKEILAADLPFMPSLPSAEANGGETAPAKGESASESVSDANVLGLLDYGWL